MSKKRKKTGKESSGVTRRDMLKIGGAAGAATILGPTMLTSWKSYAQTSIPEPIICDVEPENSPPHTPFRDNLPIPSPAIPVLLNPAPTKNANTSKGEAPRAPHQRWEQFLPDVQYYQEARPATQRFHSDYLPSYFWGFNGKYPSETPLNFYGSPTIVRFRNKLPLVHNNGGRNEITIHLHNGHTASESDGFAGDFFGPGFFKDNHYANAYAGIDAFGGIGDPREAMHTFWFHDHRARWTAPNNYLGLNGMYIVYDGTDTPLDFLAPSSSLRLPSFYGITDIPLILTDKIFCATDTARGRTEMFQEREDPEIGSSPGGDKWVVNGKIQPKHAVRRRKYRFRILNTGPAKEWNLQLVDSNGVQKPWTVVAVDANFLRTPWQPVGNLRIPVASRYDIIIDFSQFAVGTSVYLRENAAQFVSVGAAPISAGLAVENVLMRFDIIGNTIIPDTPPIPSTLVELPTLKPADAFFEWRFQRPPNPLPTAPPTSCAGQNQINGLAFDENRVDHVVLKGTTEEWTLTNDICTNNWTHPVHIHFEEGRVLSRSIRPNPTGEPNRRDPVVLLPDEATNNARRDVYRLGGQERMTIRIQFRDFVGRYLIHCHNMGHEDDFMMVRWDIVDSIAELHHKRRLIAEQRRAAGVSVEDGLPTYERKDMAG
jgi:FtsP/CotA-like multicopper oxidase with cupredoxin domain